MVSTQGTGKDEKRSVVAQWHPITASVKRNWQKTWNLPDEKNSENSKSGQPVSRLHLNPGQLAYEAVVDYVVQYKFIIVRNNPLLRTQTHCRELSLQDDTVQYQIFFIVFSLNPNLLQNAPYKNGRN
jgi:hypothetical protein